MKKFFDPEIEKLLKTSKLIEAHKAKTYKYSINDFIIEKNKWRHKDWKCWMKGNKHTVLKYINECSKPYGKRNLKEFHLVLDE